jgi:hypothetical protein
MFAGIGRRGLYFEKHLVSLYLEDRPDTGGQDILASTWTLLLDRLNSFQVSVTAGRDRDGLHHTRSNELQLTRSGGDSAFLRSDVFSDLSHFYVGSHKRLRRSLCQNLGCDGLRLSSCRMSRKPSG